MSVLTGVHQSLIGFVLFNLQLTNLSQFLQRVNSFNASKRPILGPRMNMT